jgi:hypothetical protein
MSLFSLALSFVIAKSFLWSFFIALSFRFKLRICLSLWKLYLHRNNLWIWAKEFVHFLLLLMPGIINSILITFSQKSALYEKFCYQLYNPWFKSYASSTCWIFLNFRHWATSCLLNCYVFSKWIAVPKLTKE